MIWISLALGCTEPYDIVTEVVVLDFDATCAAFWPADACANGDCATTDIEARWMAAFTTAFAAETGIAEPAVADHARIRSIHGATVTTAITEVSTQFDIDWVRIV